MIMTQKDPIEMMEVVATGLGDLLDKVVFVGGATTSLYYVDQAAQRVRPTKDIDCIVETVGRLRFNEFEEQLRQRGFRNDMTPGAPLCRWIYKGVIVDVMPIDEKILGFSNKWYEEGMAKAKKVRLPSGKEVSILELPYFVATKIEAYKNRGGGDYRMSHDIEDVITVLDSQIDFEKMYQASGTLKQYLQQEFKEYVGDEQFLESISGCVGYTQTSSARATRIIEFMREYSKAE